jgi:hypothetical protein
VAARVVAHAFARVDDEQRRFGARGAGDHVAQELGVARGIEQQVVALTALEEDAGGIDGNALRALVAKRIQQERILERLRVARAVEADRFELALGQRAGIGEEPAYDGALAMIDVTGNNQIHELSDCTRGKAARPGLMTQEKPCHMPYFYLLRLAENRNAASTGGAVATCRRARAASSAA